MYNDLLEMRLPKNTQGKSNASLVAFPDDIAVVAIFQNTHLHEDAMNPTVKKVLAWTEDKTSKLFAEKNLAIMLIT